MKFKSLYLKIVKILNFNDFKSLRKVDVLFFCGDGDRSVSFQNKQYSPLIDSVNDKLLNLGYTTITIATPFSNVYGNKAYGNVIDITGPYIRARIKYLFLKKILNRRYEFTNNPVIDLWDKILHITKPKVIIGIQPSAEFCYASKNRNIWIYDIQHGVISSEGYYGFPLNAKYKDYAIPDSILCWDKRSCDWIRNNISFDINPLLAGHPWFSRFYFKTEDDILVNTFIKKYENFSINLPIQKINILVTLQWGLDNKSFFGIPFGLYEYILHNGHEYNWFIRLHPMQMDKSNRKIIHKAFSKIFFEFKNVFWNEPSEMPLPILFKMTNLHITSFSAVTIEASWFGIKTALLNGNELNLRNYFGYEIVNRHAFLVNDNPDTINSWIVKNLELEDNLKFNNLFDYETILKRINSKA